MKPNTPMDMFTRLQRDKNAYIADTSQKLRTRTMYEQMRRKYAPLNHLLQGMLSELCRELDLPYEDYKNREA